MKRSVALTLAAAMAVVAFAAGSVVTWHAVSRDGQATQGRRVLYWVDPMHPSYKSDKPGIAPDCGMPLEPVYADDAAAAGGDVPPPTAIRVSADKQQMIGVRLGRAARAPLSRTATTVARVTVDETRVFRLATGIDGSVRDVMPVATGSLVHQDDLLLRLTARDVLTAEQSFFYGLWAVERYQKEGTEGPDQMKIAEAQVKTGADSLATYGMSDRQIEELRRTRTPTAEIEIRSPVTGFVISRTVFPNQRYDKGTELFRVADLRRVWVVADVFAADVTALAPGTGVDLVLPYDNQRVLSARVANALPAFDPASRTFKVRLEADNPGYLLWPDMVLEVRFAVDGPAALTVPADAVVDSGTRKTVFVDRGRGYFEPRVVQTGRRAGDRVEILGGLTESDAIVVSGNFMLDSESRMKAATMGLDLATSETDPVCGMAVDPARARAAGHSAAADGHDYYFCSTQCRDLFRKNPAAYVDGHAHQPVASGSIRQAALKVPADQPAGSVAATRPPLPAMLLEDRQERQAQLARQAPPSDATDRLQRTWEQANAPGAQYVPKNRLLRRPGATAGPAMVEARPDETAAPGIPNDEVQLDVACSVIVNRTEARAKGLFSDYKGKTYFFSSADCKRTFEKAPEQYINR